MAIVKANSTVLGIVTVFLLHCHAMPVSAQKSDDGPRDGAREGSELAPALLPGYRQQLTDDVAEPLDPVRPQTRDEEKREEAIAWFMAGKLREGVGDDQNALKAYKQAAELDPASVEVHRALVAVAFRTGARDAVDLAKKTVELDPDDFIILRRLGDHALRNERVGEALRYYERAAESDDLEEFTAFNVLLRRDLAVLYALAGQVEKSADNFEVLMNARLEPGRYELDFRVRRALEMDQQTSFQRMGGIFLQANRPKLALIAMRRVAKQRGARTGSHNYLLARALFANEEFKDAEAELQKYFDAHLQTGRRAPYALLKEILEKTERAGELISRLEELAKSDSRNAPLLYFLANEYADADQLDEAEDLYRKTLGGPGAGDPFGYRGIAMVHRKQKKADAFLESLTQAYKRLAERADPNQSNAAMTALESEISATAADEGLVDDLIGLGVELKSKDIPQLQTEAAYLLARIADDADKDDASIDFYRFVVNGKPPASIALDTYRELGGLLMELDRYDESIEVFRQAANDPALPNQRPFHMFRLSQVQELNDQTEDALETIVEAQRLMPRSGLLRYQEGWVYYHAQRWTEAIEVLERVMREFAGDKDTLRRCQFSLSNVYVQMGELRKGEEVLEKVLEEEPDDPSVNNDLGYLYADQGKNLEKAEKMIRKAVEAEPENAAYQDSMGWVLYRLERYDEALPWLEKARDAPDGGDTTILEHLGDCYDKLKRSGDAKDAWDKSLKQARESDHPDEEQIERLLKKTGSETVSKDNKDQIEGSDSDAAN